MKEETKHRLLLSIANTLSLYAYHMQDAGLAGGKAGVMLFLYAYARYSGQEYYSDFAGEMLDGLLKNARMLPPDFGNGLAGVGWAVDRLLKEGHVGGDPDKVLAPVDRDLLARTAYEKAVPNLGMGIYWAERTTQAESEGRKNLDAFCTYLLDGLRHGRHAFHLGIVNSILHFLNKAGQRIDGDTAAKIRALLRPVAQEVLERSAFVLADLHLFSKMRTGCGIALTGEDMGRKAAFLMTLPLSVEDSIKVAWRQLVYFGKASCPLPDSETVEKFVNKSLQDIRLEQFMLDGGLAGMGMWLMNAE